MRLGPVYWHLPLVCMCFQLVYSPGHLRCVIVCAPPQAPCFVELRNKHAPRNFFTLLRAPGNRTVCKERTILFLISQ